MDKQYIGYVHLSRFLQHVCPMIIQRKMKPASAEDLFEAFSLLDPEETGYIEKDLFVKLMTEEGEPFTQQEIDETLPVAVDPLTGKILYEFYLNQLTVSSNFYISLITK